MASLGRARSLPRKILRGTPTPTAPLLALDAPAVAPGSGGLHNLPQQVVQNPAVAEVLELVERVDAAEQLDLLHLAGGSMDAAGEVAPRLEALRHAENVVALGAVELETLARGAVLELQRQHADAHEVRAVNALEALDDHRLDAQQQRALRRPVARGAPAVLPATDAHQRHAFLL